MLEDQRRNLTMRAKEIIEFKPHKSILSGAERKQLAAMVEALAAESGAGKALSALWQQQKAIGFILGNPSEGENLNDKKFLSKMVGPYWLIHSSARKDRRDVSILKKSGILGQNPVFVYDKLKDGVYAHHPTKRHGFKDICFLCSAKRANPNEVLISTILGNAEFVYGANFATLGHCHFTAWTKVPILQKHWPYDSLIWLCLHGRWLASDTFTTFFNGLGAGNSIKHFHYQTLREEFPISLASQTRQFQSSGIDRLEWPMPAYRTTIRPDQELSDGIARMDRFISHWVNMNPIHSLNLVHTTDLSGRTYIIFVPRVASPEKRRPREISNDFAGCEVGGRINIEDKQQWKWAAAQDEATIAKMLECLAPPKTQIESLERSLRH